MRGGFAHRASRNLKMTRDLEIRMSGRSVATRIVVGCGEVDRAGTWVTSLSPSACVVVSEQNVLAILGDRVARSLRSADLPCETFTFAEGEASKSGATVAALHEFFSRVGLDRRGVVIAFGGGVVSDVAGFAAATWMRGVRHVNVPTTLEGMIDASIGGKTGINLPAGKNLVGAFHHPVLVVMDPQCLGSLPPRDFRAGLAESVKHAVVFDEAFVTWHEENAGKILELDPPATEVLLRRNAEIKSGVVSADPYEETGERALLNFGHTIGHAIESASGYGLRHGECVALGMAAACRISQRRSGLSPAEGGRVVRLIRSLELPSTLGEAGAKVGGVDVDVVMARLASDKKAVQGRARFVLLEQIGKACLAEDVSASDVREAVEGVLGV
ncbi:MAG: 3-dehydroquinate synthase [Planctomycetota bacterium]|nr:MAG: 3-dehydroquinate synthase [Planctomycetota bacterium]KAB2949439.1 MAG: 3-dehydroquinate synthase [Phycisphaerae bacterium]MCQ3920882.1 3-dehydroquinate synthase [Planctomycetota bacterium]